MVPGIMGSQLGFIRGGDRPNDILWLDPIDFTFGRLMELKFSAGLARGRAGRDELHVSQVHAVAARGGLRCGAARLRLAPRRCFARQTTRRAHRRGWPRGSGARRPQHGRPRGARRADACRPAARLAGRHAGHPNSGSVGAAQALRGTYTVVRKLAMLDRRHDAEFLAREVFSTFPGLHELLPANKIVGDFDFFEAPTGPAGGPDPTPSCSRTRRDSSSASRRRTSASM